MASTLVLLTVFQLVTTALCITSVDDTAKVKDIDNDRLEDDLDTDETGWVYNPIQEKVRALEYLKSKVLSPFATLQSPSTFYGGSYPIYSTSSGGGLTSSFSYGSKYPYYYSNGYKNNYYTGYYRPGVVSYPSSVQLKSKFNTYPSFGHIQKPFYTPKLWYNKGYYGGSSYYAPGCFYPAYKPSVSYTPSYSYSAGTPLSYQYSTSYGVPSASYSSKANVGFGLRSYAVPSYSYDAGQSSSSFSLPSLPNTQYPHLPSTPQPPTNFQYPSVPSLPSLPANPSNTFLIKSVIAQTNSDDSQSSAFGFPNPPNYNVPALPSVPSAPTTPSYPSIPMSPYPGLPSTPTLPSAPSIPSAPTYPSPPSIPSAPTYPSPPAIPSAPSFPSTPSPPSPSSWGSLPYSPVLRQDYSALLPNVQSIENDNQEVVITPPPPTKAKTNYIAALPGSSVSILSDQYPYAPYGYAVSSYPNVFYISNQQNNERPSAAGGSGSSGDSQSVQPVSTDESTGTSTDSTTSSETSTETSSQRSSRPVITTFYSSNTIDQSRIPLLYTAEQYTVPAGGVYYSSPMISSGQPSFSYSYGPSLPQGLPALPQTKSGNTNAYAYSSFGLGGSLTAQPLSATTASPPC